MSDIEPTTGDELVSAYIDDEVTADQRARVEGDPSLLARAEALRGASVLVGQGVPSTGDVRERSIAAALAEFDLGAGATPPGAARSTEQATTGTSGVSSRSAPVVDLGAARRQRRRLIGLGAAAAILVGVLAVPALWSRTSDTTELANTAADTEPASTAESAATEEVDEVDEVDDTADAATESDDSANATATEQAEVTDDADESADAEDPEETSPAPLGREGFSDTIDIRGRTAIELGDQPDHPTLSAAVAAQLQLGAVATGPLGPDSATDQASSDDSTAPALDPFVECLARYRATGAVVSAVTFTAKARVQGQDVLVYVIDQGPNTTDMIVTLDIATCAVVFEQGL